MLEFALRLFDTEGFEPEGTRGPWTPMLVWMHIGGDLFIWLAYISIPLVLLYFTRRRDLPYPRLFVLFALFILACGFGHFIEALTFKYPLFRLAGAWKVVTAILSWVTVLVLISVIPRVMAISRGPAPSDAFGDTTLRRLTAPAGPSRLNDYIIAILSGVLALLLRAAVDPLVDTDHVYVLSLFAVVFVSWQCGFGPGIVTLLVSMVGMVFFFISPRYSLVVDGLGNQLATAMFFFCGVCCAGLGEAQRLARRRAKAALEVALERRAELETEVARRKQVENALRVREAELIELNQRLAAAQVETTEALAQLDAFLDNAPVGIAYFDTEQRYLRVNPYLATANGRSATDHIGKAPREVVRGFPDGLFDAIVNATRPGTKSVVRTDTIPSPSGAPVLWRANVFPVHRSDGSLLGVGVIREDVTERERVAEALRESEGRFRSMADSAPAMIWLSDLDRRRTYFNRTWLEFTGRRIEQELGDGWAENIHPDDRELYQGAYHNAIAHRKPFEVEYKLRRRDGEYRWVMARGTPRFTPSGAFTGFVGLCMDVTDRKTIEQTLERMVRTRTAELVDEIEERKRAEQQVRAVAAELERSNSELEQFAYIASHDLQEPLRKIQAFGDRLQTRFREELSDTGKEYLDRMHASAGRMRRLIDDLLNYSRVTTTTRRFIRVNLGKLVREVVADLDERIEQAGGTIKIGELPEIDADPTQMRQLFQNLIANAVKFQRPDVPPVVEVFGERVIEPLPGSDGELVPACKITVRDNGIGFDEKYLDRIFQVFQRLHGRDEYEGTGVGLAICRKITERHGGTITARSRAGEGAAFVATLPIRQPREEATADVQPDAEVCDDPDGR